MKRILLMMGVCIFLTGTSFGQTTLSAGDIAISVANADGNDTFSFVLLIDIASSTEINFTDNGWLPESSAYRTGEGIITWTASTSLGAGTEVTVSDASSGSRSSNYGSVSASGSYNMSGSGDQINVYQGTLGSPTNLYSYNMDSQGFLTTDGDANTSNNTGLPSGLTENTNAVALPHADNYQYNCPTITDATKANKLSSFMNSSNYNSSSSTVNYTPVGCNFFDAIISGDEGWRLLSLPVTGGLVSYISEDSPVQGITGGSDASATDENFILYTSTAAFSEPTDVSTAWGDGLGFGMYFFNNTTNSSSTLPVSLDISALEPSSQVDVTLNAAASGYTLVGNPFASNYDLNSLTATSSNISSNVAFWNDGTGLYSVQDRTTPYIVAPWQGFWVQTVSAAATTLSFPTSGKSTSSSTGSFFSKKADNRADINFTFKSESTNDEARLSFRSGATFGYDVHDFGKLTPLLPAYATIAFASNDMLKSVESLPYDLDREVTVELQPQLVGVSGEFTFAWNGLETIPAEWELTLHDYEMDASVNMRDASEYVFTAGAQAKANPNPLSLLTGPAAVAMKAKTEGNRFGITIRPTSVNNELDETPLSFGLAQNYPNPFNPATTINYTIENAGAVNLSVYNLMGQQVATLVNEAKTAGTHSVRWNAAGAASGMYYYRLEANGQSITRKMTLIK